MLLGEDFLNTNEFHTSLILYSSCSKIPVQRGNFWGFGVTYFVFTFGHYACFTLTLISLFLCFRRLRQLEKQKFEGIMVVTYDKDGVTISNRSPDLQSCHKLLKHYRTVVSPQASLISFIFSLFIYLLWAIFFFTMDPSGSSLGFDALLFIHPSQLFLFHTFIETTFSPTLRNSLIDYFSFYRGSRNPCHVYIV